MDAMRHEDKTMTTTPDQSLVTWRATMGFNQREAAEALGCSPADLADWERGAATTPRFIRLAMAALALGIEAE
jgi:transcriptional regulator with XRE-family HTH domain